MKKIIFTGIAALSVLYSCDLEPELIGVQSKNNLTDEQISSGALTTAYNNLPTVFEGNSGTYTCQQISSDEMAIPTRGTDWDDGGKWRDLHLHTWNGANAQVLNAWNDVLSGFFAATEATGYNAPASRVTEGTFLQSLYIFLATDLFGQVPYRDPNPNFADLPQVWKRTEAIDIAINKLEAVYSNLPEANTPQTANKYAAAALLAKMYLNRGVYLATDADGTPKIPTATDFTPADMQKVIDHCNTVIAGPFSFSTDYFDNFANANSKSPEAVYSAKSNVSIGAGNLRGFSYATTHYNQNPGGWNGFAALTDLYNKFSSTDPRIGGTSYDGLTDKSGLLTGFLIGQQYDREGNIIKDRTGNNLAFTSEFNLASSVDVSGIRVIKYMPQFEINSEYDETKPENPENHKFTAPNSPINTANFIIFRLSDVYLMKAEAQARMGDMSAAMTTINMLRTARGVEDLTALTLLDILDERARELYWEGWRRQDQIRFGTFNNPVQGRSTTTDRHVLIFPIPDTPLSTNPNLTQNPGY